MRCKGTLFLYLYLFYVWAAGIASWKRGQRGVLLSNNLEYKKMLTRLALTFLPQCCIVV